MNNSELKEALEKARLALKEIAKEAARHREYNPVSGTYRQHGGFIEIIKIANSIP